KDAPDATQLINAFNGTHRFIIDYLVEEVLVQRPSGTREFLLKTSMLHRLSAPLCDELLASTQSQETLEQLDAANFFLIPLDSQRRWYRYHHLFADVLRQHALQAYPTELPTLYQRAAHWFEANEFLNDAIEMALAGKDFEMAANLIQRAAETVIWDQGEWLLLDRWLTTLPESHLKTQPRLMLYRAWGSF
ncbi:MAG: hypothetical protein KC423_29490, partial [Anaerolineales bacterium]|nr:hypothetical protein [Anaerolineales bacterium]